MCGRFTLAIHWAELAKLYRTIGQVKVEPRYNIAPSQRVFVVRRTPAANELAEVRWGLIPAWAKDAKIGNRCINARSETFAEKPAFRNAWKAGRRYRYYPGVERPETCSWNASLMEKPLRATVLIARSATLSETRGLSVRNAGLAEIPRGSDGVFKFAAVFVAQTEEGDIPEGDVTMTLYRLDQEDEQIGTTRKAFAVRESGTLIAACGDWQYSVPYDDNFEVRVRFAGKEFVGSFEAAR